MKEERGGVGVKLIGEREKSICFGIA